jgi:hypothetical protein
VDSIESEDCHNLEYAFKPKYMKERKQVSDVIMEVDMEEVQIEKEDTFDEVCSV